MNKETSTRPATALDLLEKRLRGGYSYSEVGEFCMRYRELLLVELHKVNTALTVTLSASRLDRRVGAEDRRSGTMRRGPVQPSIYARRLGVDDRRDNVVDRRKCREKA